MSDILLGGTLNRVVNDTGGHRLLFHCPGCKFVHGPTIGPGEGPRWTWNDDTVRPTFNPSLLVRWTEHDVPKVCHSYVIDGRIQFLGDCTHELAGQTVPIPPFEW